LNDATFRQTLGDFSATLVPGWRAFPHETQILVAEALREAHIRENASVRPLPAKHGHELVVEFEREARRIVKRIIHHTPFEQATGVDIILEKYLKDAPELILGTVGIQVKRSGGKSYFSFDKEDLAQMQDLREHWRSRFYLLVDDSREPEFRFLRSQTLEALAIHELGVSDLRQATRGIRIDRNVFERGMSPETFYRDFDHCYIGALMGETEVLGKVEKYSLKTRRMLVEVCGNMPKEFIGIR
jgi:hypothetical protein